MKIVKKDYNLIELLNKYKKCNTMIKILGIPIILFLLFLLILQLLLTMVCLKNQFTPISLPLLPLICAWVNIGRTKCYQKIKQLESLIRGLFTKSEYFNIETDIHVVPGKLKVGENLEARNLTPIFEEGKWIIIKAWNGPSFFFQPDEQDPGEIIPEPLAPQISDSLKSFKKRPTEVYEMEPTSEDMAILKEALPEYKKELDEFFLDGLADSLTEKSLDHKEELFHDFDELEEYIDNQIAAADTQKIKKILLKK